MNESYIVVVDDHIPQRRRRRRRRAHHFRRVSLLSLQTITSLPLSFFSFFVCARTCEDSFFFLEREIETFFCPKNLDPKTNETTLDLVNKTLMTTKQKKETLQKSRTASTEIGMVSGGVHQCNAILSEESWF